MTFPLVLMSFGVGALIGLTGMGGAALMAPFLILVLGVQPTTAVGTDLVYGAATKIVGAWIHLRQDTVDLPVVRRLATGSVPGGLAGAVLVLLLPRYAHDTEYAVRRGIGGLLVVVAVVLLLQTLFLAKKLSGGVPGWLRDRAMPLWGAAAGFCVGFTSVGSGSLLTPLLMLRYPSRPATVVGTDVFHAAILVAVTGLVYVGSGGVEWKLVPVLLAGAIPGVLVGSKIAARARSRPLRFLLSIVLLLSGYGLM